MDDNSDQALMMAVGAGDVRAFEQLAARHGPWATQLAARVSGNASDADDIVQEALLRVWVKAPVLAQRARRRAGAGKRRARELMAADPLDATALSTALAEMGAASAALQNVTHTVMLETAPRLGAESRRKLADALRAQ